MYIHPRNRDPERFPGRIRGYRENMKQQKNVKISFLFADPQVMRREK